MGLKEVNQPIVYMIRQIMDGHLSHNSNGNQFSKMVIGIDILTFNTYSIVTHTRTT